MNYMEYRVDRDQVILVITRVLITGVLVLAFLF